MSYIRFGAMIATSTVVMFVLMYLNIYAWEHVFFSETRTYMAILMGATMAIIMLGFMLGMYTNTKANIAIFVGSAVVFALTLWLVRSQATVGQVSYMRAMIPHHSIAIMTSERAEITDPRVRKLADEIIEAQRREIAEMRYLIADLSRGGESAPSGSSGAEERPEIVPLAQALRSTVIGAVDPEPLKPTEAEQAVGAGPGCEFRRTAESDPILVARTAAAGPGAGAMKLHGKLVLLQADETGEGTALAAGASFQTDGGRMSVRPLAEGEGDLAGILERSNADLVFELAAGLTVGYRGFYRCDP